MAVLAVITGLLTSCAVGPVGVTVQTAPPAAKFGTHDDFRHEYRDAVAALAPTLPEGIRMPEEPAGRWDVDGTYEEGAGTMQAALSWQCAWMHAYVVAKRADDPGGIYAALGRLEGWVDLPLVSPHVDAQSQQAWKTDVIQTAKAGTDAALVALSETCG